MSRLVCILGLALLGGCNAVVTQGPLFTTADEAGAPPLKPGLWRFDGDSACKVDEAKPLVEWPTCAGGAVMDKGVASFYERKTGTPVWTQQALIFAAGTPRVGQAQVAVSGDLKVESNPYLYVGARADKLDKTGRVVALTFWLVQCGPPSLESDASLAGAKTPLPGLTMKPGDPACTTTSVDALRAAAKASEGWSRKTLAAHWVRDGR